MGSEVVETLDQDRTDFTKEHSPVVLFTISSENHTLLVRFSNNSVQTRTAIMSCVPPSIFETV